MSNSENWGSFLLLLATALKTKSKKTWQKQATNPKTLGFPGTTTDLLFIRRFITCHSVFLFFLYISNIYKTCLSPLQCP